MKVTYESNKKSADVLKSLAQGTQSYILLKAVVAGPKTVDQLTEKIQAGDSKKEQKTARNNVRWYLVQLSKAGALTANRELKAEKKPAVKKVAKAVVKKVSKKKVTSKTKLATPPIEPVVEEKAMAAHA
jgi:hypothetical protein